MDREGQPKVGPEKTVVMMGKSKLMDRHLVIESEGVRVPSVTKTVYLGFLLEK